MTFQTALMKHLDFTRNNPN